MAAMKRAYLSALSVLLVALFCARDAAAAVRHLRAPPGSEEHVKQLEAENAELREELRVAQGMPPAPAPAPDPKVAADVAGVADAAAAKAELPSKDPVKAMKDEQEAVDSALKGQLAVQAAAAAAAAEYAALHGPQPVPAPAPAPAPAPVAVNPRWEAHLRSLEFAAASGAGCGFNPDDGGYGSAPGPGPAPDAAPLSRFEQTVQPFHKGMAPALDRHKLPTSVGTPAAFCPYCRFCCACNSNGIEEGCQVSTVRVSVEKAWGAMVFCSTCHRDCTHCAATHNATGACPGGNCCDPTTPLKM